MERRRKSPKRESNQIEKLIRTRIQIERKKGTRLYQANLSFLQALIAPIKGYVDAFGEFAVCLKDCVLEKNKNGFCFDRKK